ncbi:TolC family protein [Candidatus Tisiphia endosymbiont of Nemotelus uliginosus]|uniref:TolC family protein n=1 Tax=Candidatus Tisiphia endosymbiont of Nemotelus uliginosus TaxID=3077926 RepID=UPI0035C8C898
MKRLIYLIIIFLFHPSVFSIELQEALTTAYTKNHELQHIRTNFLIEIEQFSAAFSGFLPKVAYQINLEHTKGKVIGRYSEDPSTREKARSTQGTQSQQGAFILEQPIFSGGSSVAELKAAQSAFRAARAKYYAGEQKVLLDLITTYIGCYEAKEKYNIAAISVKINKQQLETIDEKLKLGEATLVDIAAAKAGLAKAETAELTAYANLQAANAKFAEDFGIEVEDVTMPQLPDNIPSTKEALMQKAININPNIDRTRHEVKSLKASELAAKADLLPKVSFKVQTGKINYDHQDRYNNKVNNRSVTSTLSVNIPIYSQGVEYSRIRKAKNNTRNTVIQLDNTIKQVQTNVVRSWEGFAAAKSKIIAATQGVEASQIAYDGVMQEEIVGSKTVLDVLTAEENLYKAKLSKVDAHKEEILAAYQIKSLIGELTARSLKLNVKYFTPEDALKSLKKKLVIGS